MGVKLLPHEERYQRTAAFIEILKGLWADTPGTFNHHSAWYDVKDGYCLPQPKRMPEIANAGTSEDAKEMTTSLCDWAFISTPTVEAISSIVEDISLRAAKKQKQVECAAFPFVLWRDSEDEAQNELEKIIAQKDEVAAQNWLDGLAIGSGSFDQFTLDMMTVGAGAVHVIGTAEQVATKIKTMHDAGLKGVLMIFQAYLQDTIRFRKEIMPLLYEMGVISKLS